MERIRLGQVAWPCVQQMQGFTCVQQHARQCGRSAHAESKPGYQSGERQRREFRTRRTRQTFPADLPNGPQHGSSPDQQQKTWVLSWRRDEVRRLASSTKTYSATSSAV